MVKSEPTLRECWEAGKGIGASMLKLYPMATLLFVTSFLIAGGHTIHIALHDIDRLSEFDLTNPWMHAWTIMFTSGAILWSQSPRIKRDALERARRRILRQHMPRR